MDATSEDDGQGLAEHQMDALRELVKKRGDLDPERRALVESLAEKHKIDLPKVSAPESGLASSLKQAVLPMGGALVGGMAGSVLGPAGTIGGEVLGGMAGLKANELLGISTPDAVDYGLTVAAPGAGAGLAKAGRRLIPGAQAAEQQIGAEQLKQTPNLIQAPLRAEVQQAYAKIGQTPLPVPNFQAKASEILSSQANVMKYKAHNPQIKSAMQAVTDTLAKNPQGIPMDEVNGLLKAYRLKVEGLDTKGGELYGAYKALRGSLFKDMEQSIAQAGTGSEAMLLREAMGKAKQQIAKDEYVDLIGKYGTKMETVGKATFETIQPTKILNKLRDLDWEKSVGTAQYKKIEKTLKQLAAIPHPSAEMRTGIGSQGRAIAMAGAGIIGAGTGAALGAQGAMGGAVGSALTAYTAIKVHDAVANLFMSDAGRNFLVKVFKANQGRIGERTAQTLIFGASQFQNTSGVTPGQERLASGLTDIASNPDPDWERRMRLGIPNQPGPQFQQAP